MKRPDPPGAISFPVPTFSGRVLLCTKRDVYQKAHQQFHGSEDKRLHTYRGISSHETEGKEESVYLIGLFEGGDTTLVHELVHVVFMILSHSCVPINKKNDEVFAYLLDRLFSTAKQAMTKRKRR